MWSPQTLPLPSSHQEDAPKLAIELNSEQKKNRQKAKTGRKAKSSEERLV